VAHTSGIPATQGERIEESHGSCWIRLTQTGLRWQDGAWRVRGARSRDLLRHACPDPFVTVGADWASLAGPNPPPGPLRAAVMLDASGQVGAGWRCDARRVNLCGLGPGPQPRGDYLSDARLRYGMNAGTEVLPLRQAPRLAAGA